MSKTKDLPVSQTIYQSATPLTKNYRIEDRKIAKDANVTMYKGKAKRITVPFKKVFIAMQEAKDNIAFGYGVHDSKYPQTVDIVVNGKEKPEENILARTNNYFSFPEGPAILMIDYDVNRYGAELTREEFMVILIDVFPQFALAAYFLKESVSAGVHLKGESPKTIAGFHLYFAVLVGSNIPAFAKLLYDRLWLKGYGYIAISGNGNLLERSIIDLAIYSPERLDIVAKPNLLDEGLEYTPRDPIYHSGGYLDTSLLPPLSEDEKEQLQKLIAEKKEALREQAAQILESWKMERIASMVEKGSALDVAEKQIEEMLKGGCKYLPADFLLEFSDGINATVAEVCADLKKYDGKTLADPVEGRSYGKSKAKLWANDGNPIISSLAHGVQTTYYLKMKTWMQVYDEHVEFMNKTLASVIIGGKHQIMRRELGVGIYEGMELLVYYSRRDLALVYDNQSIKVGEKLTHGKLVDVLKNPILAWAAHPNARTYVNGVCFAPGETVREGCLNIWQGFTVAPCKNNGLLKPLLEHIYYVICNGIDELYDYLLSWIAYTFQNPDKQAGSAIVLRGEKGSGKGTLAHFLVSIWGVHGLHITNEKYLVGNFNGHLGYVCLLYADEAFFSGNLAHEGTLKGLITEPTLLIERKGLQAVQQTNYLKIFMTTNSDYAVPSTRDERRFFVSDVSSEYVGNLPYFDKLREVCGSTEVQAAFLYKMLNRDLTGWHSGAIPESTGLREQRFFTMKPHQQWLANCLSNGYFDTEVCGMANVWPEKMMTSKIFESYIAWCDKAKKGEYKRVSQVELAKYLGKIYNKTKHAEGDHRGFVFGNHKDAVKAFEVYEKVSLKELIQ